jgi:hypothetical protein
MTEFKPSCGEHWRFSFKCDACENDAKTLKELACKEHPFEDLNCAACGAHHTDYHMLYRLEFYDCGYCKRRRSEREHEEKKKRKLAGIEKRRQTMAARKLALAPKK